jgi:nucleoside-diphosphate-sugar epimerase
MRRDDVYGEIFNIGATQEISILKLAETVRDMAQSSSPIVTVPYEDAYEPGFEDMMRRLPDTTKIRERLAWEPTKPLPIIIRDVIDYSRPSDGSPQGAGAERGREIGRLTEAPSAAIPGEGGSPASR